MYDLNMQWTLTPMNSRAKFVKLHMQLSAKEEGRFADLLEAIQLP